MKQVAIITGGTSGIGQAAAEVLSNAGYQVYTFSRRGAAAADSQGTSTPASADRAAVTHLSVDVTDPAAVQRAVEEIREREPRIDLVVNCAGFGISGAIEFTPLADAKRLMDVDFFGTVNVNQALIPLMRQQGVSSDTGEAGRIVNISSVAGPAAIPFQAYYSCAKAAVDAYTAALANELKPFSITVTSIRPGDVKTGFTAAREKKHEGNDIYGGRIDKSVAKMEKDEVTGASPMVLGRYILKIARIKNPKPYYTPGIVYKACILLIKLLPCRLVNQLIGVLYVVK